MKWLIVAAALAIVTPLAIGQDVEADAVDYLKRYGYIATAEGTNSVKKIQNQNVEEARPIWGSAKVSSPSIGQDDEAEAYDYLKKYGYIDTARSRNFTGRKDTALCRSKIDVIVHISDRTSYVFTGDKYYRLTNDNVATGYPKMISREWPGLPNNLDAAVTWKEQDVTYFFKRSQYWRFTGQTPSTGYPRHISAWQGLPANLDAAFEWGRNNHLYFFKGSQYWKFDTDQQTMPDGYPKNISRWMGVPSYIDAAFQWKNGKTYFFKSRNYWRFNDDSVVVDRANPTYPRNTGEWWFNCPKDSQRTIPILDTEP